MARQLAAEMLVSSMAASHRLDDHRKGMQMDATGFDNLSQEIGALLSRRGLLRTGALGAAGLGLGLVTSRETMAKKGKQGKKKGDINKLCKTQVAQCETLLGNTCAGDPTCLNTVQTCCPAVGTCDLSGFLSCLLIN